MADSDKKVRVAVIFPKDSEHFFNPQSRLTFGGANVQMYLIGDELSKRKTLSTFFLVNDYQNIEQYDRSLNIITTYRLKDFFPIKLIKFYRALKKARPDVIIQRGLTIYSCLLAFYTRLLGIKFIFMFAHDRELAGRYQGSGKKAMLFWMLKSFSTHLVCQSQAQLSRLPKPLHKKSSIVKTGYEIKEFNSEKDLKSTILWVGRLEVWKRPELFVKLAELNPSFKFVMIAPVVKKEAEYGKMIHDLSRRIPNLKIYDFVSFFEIENFFLDAKLFVNTSIEEGFPNTFIQAAKNLTPIVSLNVNPDDFIGRFQCGVWCNNSFPLLNKEIKRLMKATRSRKEMGLNGYQYAKTHHHIVKTVNEIIKLF